MIVYPPWKHKADIFDSHCLNTCMTRNLLALSFGINQVYKNSTYQYNREGRGEKNSNIQCDFEGWQWVYRTVQRSNNLNMEPWICMSSTSADFQTSQTHFPHIQRLSLSVPKERNIQILGIDFFIPKNLGTKTDTTTVFNNIDKYPGISCYCEYQGNHMIVYKN